MKASEIIKEKLIRRSGETNIKLYKGDYCNIQLKNNTISSDKVPNTFELSVFDIVTDFLLTCPEYKAKKGDRQHSRVGEGKCMQGTLSYEIATKYFGTEEGKYCLNPIFMIVAVLRWADVVENGWGFVKLKPDFIAQR